MRTFDILAPHQTSIPDTNFMILIYEIYVLVPAANINRFLPKIRNEVLNFYPRYNSSKQIAEGRREIG